MATIATKLTIHEKMVKVQSELKAPKGQYNEFGKYKYRSCEDIVEAVKPILAKYGLYLKLSDQIEAIGERFYVIATATVSDGDDEINTSAYAREDLEKKGMDGSQITGAASSYARKYALNGLFAIDDTKDADATNTHGKESTEVKTTAAKVKVTKANVDALKLKMESKNVEEIKILTAYKVKKLEDLTFDQWNSAMNRLDKN